jgi:CheY-like chemotaxis protein
VPVLGLTGYVGADEVQRCREAGMQDALSKPIAREILAQAVTAWARAPREAAA